VNTVNGIVTSLAGGGSLRGTAAGFADGTGSAAIFNAPWGLAVGADTSVYVADLNNNLVRRIIIATGVVSVLAGGGSPGGIVAGYTDGTGAVALSPNAPLYTPTAPNTVAMSVSYTVQNYLAAGIEPSKISVGIAMYGHTYYAPGLANWSGFGAPAQSSGFCCGPLKPTMGGQPGPAAGQCGTYMYSEIVASLPANAAYDNETQSDIACAFNAHNAAPARCARNCDPNDPKTQPYARPTTLKQSTTPSCPTQRTRRSSTARCPTRCPSATSRAR
jgi:hypothetical protein